MAMYSLKSIVAFLLSFFLWVQLIHAHDSKYANLPGCTTTVTKLEPKLFPELQSERHKINYGPFAVRPRDHDNGMQGYKCIPPHPCSDCMILSMHAGLEYLDGSDAMPQNGMMLHHAVFQNLHRPDPICNGKRHERFFASGDERTLVDLTFGSLNRYGYVLDSTDMLLLALELMNMKDQREEVALTVTWEFMQKIPSSFKSVQPYWFDIGACGSSDKPARKDAIFNYTSLHVKAPKSGVIATSISHLHSGGTHLALVKDGKPLCTSNAHYAHDHIQEITTCNDLSYSKGDEFSIAAYYNTSKHAPMTHADGSLEPVMGISIVYAVEDTAVPSHRKRAGILVGSMLITGVLLFSLCFYILCTRKSSKDTMPVWFRDQYKSYKSIIRVDGREDRRRYEPLIDYKSGEEDEQL